MDPTIHKHHKVKFLSRQVDQGNPIPLLNIEQIEDLSKIYQYKKKTLNIQNQKPNKSYWIPEEEKQVKIELSAEQVIEQYKKNMYETAKRKKNASFFIGDLRPRKKLQATPLRKVLKRMSQYSITQDKSSSYMNEIRQSERQLHYVKCNPMRKRRVITSASSQFHRKKILSLKDGLPMQIGQIYPTLQQKIDQMKLPPQPQKLSFAQRFQRTMNNFFPQSGNKNYCNQSLNYFNSQKIKQQKLINKAKSSINQSVDTVQKIVTTIGDHYQMKHKHKQDYGQLASTWKVDRPRTQQLRSRSYNIDMISKNKKKNLLDAFRTTTQSIRTNEIERSRRFYDQLLIFVLNKTKTVDKFPLTKFICNSIRQQLEINLKLSIGFLASLIIQVQKISQKDQLAEYVIKKTKQYIQFSS